MAKAKRIKPTIDINLLNYLDEIFPPIQALPQKDLSNVNYCFGQQKVLGHLKSLHDRQVESNLKD
tara:strand:+ start:423 stop:617 length:195 start_codon:yes stop_codon:yes gene_type:complete